MSRDLLTHLTTLRARAVTAANVVPHLPKSAPIWRDVAAIARETTAPWHNAARGDRALPPSSAQPLLP